MTLARRGAGRIRPELDNLRKALVELGNPQRSFRSILIVGTNGKGSTAAMTEAVLRGHAVRSGLYTSPHLVRVEERIRIAGAAVARDVLEQQLERLDRFPDLTYFETLTAAAFAVFAEAGVEVAVLEAGMGGTWDATRLAESAVAGLTNVGTDHRGWLGADRLSIARDKGRALAAAAWPVVGAGISEEILAAVDAPSAVAAGSLVRSELDEGLRTCLRWPGGETTVRLPLPGAHQLDNVQLALALCARAAAAGWMADLEPQKVRVAIEGLRWPGRLSVHCLAGRQVVVDCAHNLEGAAALAAYLGGLERRFHLLFSCLDDKPVAAMAAVLRPAVEEIVVCELADDRAMPIERLLAAFPGARPAPDPAAALSLLPDPVLAAGSVRLVGSLLAGSNGAEAW